MNESSAAASSEHVTTAFSRRAFFGKSARLAGTVAAASLIPDGLFSRATSAAAGLDKIDIQLNYIENIQFAGDMVALAEGYYAKEGFSVTLQPGGPDIAPEPVVASSKALVGITHTTEACQAIVNGAAITIIGAGYQKNPFCMISSANKPLKTPESLYGKKVGVSASNTATWQAFVAGAKLDVSKIHVVPVTFDITPLAAGEIDALMGFYTNEPILLAARGFKPYVWLFADFGYPLMEEVYIARNATLASATGRAQLVRFMTAESRGWYRQTQQPALGARLATDVYGKNLHLVLSEQIKAAEAQNALVVSPDTKKHGLFWMTPELVQKTVHSTKLGGVAARSSMFTNEVLAHVYAKGPIV